MSVTILAFGPIRSAARIAATTFAPEDVPSKRASSLASRRAISFASSVLTSRTPSPHARYALIESGAGGLDVRHIEVEYPWDAAAAAALANGCPDWAVWLRTGRA